MSPTPDSTLDDPQQVIADLQRKLDESNAERDEALEQQAAIAEVLQVINSSPGDVAPVFSAIVEKARRLCGAARGALRTFDGESFHLVAAHGGEADEVERLRELGAIRANRADDGYGRIACGERVVHIADLRETDDYRDDPGLRERIDLRRIRTWLAVALHKDDVVLGTITVHRQEVRPFSHKEIGLIRNFADQAVIAIENARLITETREALEQQTATAELLQVINSSPGDLAPVFDAMLEKARVLCGFAHGTFNIYDGEYFRTVAFHGIPEPFAEVLRQPHRTGPNFERLLRGERVVHIADITTREFSPDDPIHRAAVDAGVRTVLFVPLRKDGALLGYITANRREVRPFTDKQIALLQNFAAQAVIAMENARLITETREALEQQTATAEVLQVINSSPGDLAPVFDAMLEKAISLCEASFGILWTYDGEYLHASAITGLPPQFAEFLKQGPHRPARMQQALLSGEPFGQIADLTKTEVYQSGETLPRAAANLGGVRTLLGITLRKDNRVLGIFGIYRQEVRPFSSKQIALLQNFAAQAVIAMENARLITETREALEQQTATAEVLQVINSSPGDLTPVFDAILEKAHTLCGASFGALGIREGEFFRAVALRGPPAALTEVGRRAFRSLPDEPVGQLLRGEPFIQVPDMAELAPRAPEGSLGRALVELAGVRTQLLVALRKDDAVLGFISAYRQEVRPFSDKEITLLQNFAAQAVIAMENARLLGELRQRTNEVGELNRDLEARVAEQVDELGRVGRLKRFLAPQLAELIVSQGDEKILESHRREIVVVFCDLRGYTAFTETAEPEEVLDFLREYHGALGPLVSQFEGTLDQFSGDGIMVFFNDPVPCPDPAERAVKMAVAMRSAANTLIADWRERGRDLGFGAGIAQGYATLGQIGFSERSGYTAIGTVCNVAARLCAEAKDGQILLGQRVNVALKGSVATEQLGPLTLKGLSQPVVAYNVPLGAIQPAFRVIEGGPQSV